MDKGAKGCEVVVSGKLRGQRAKAMKFRDGYMIHAGDATNYYVEKAVKHVHLRQGVIGIKVYSHILSYLFNIDRQYYCFYTYEHEMDRNINDIMNMIR